MQVIPHRQIDGSVVRMGQRRHAAPEQSLLGRPEHLREGRIHVDDLAIAINQGDPYRRCPHGGPEPLLALFQGDPGPHLGIDVTHPNDPHEVPFRTQYRTGTSIHPQPTAATTSDTELPGRHSAVIGAVFKGIGHGVPVRVRDELIDTSSKHFVTVPPEHIGHRWRDPFQHPGA